MAVDAVEAFLEREGRQVWATRCVSGRTHVCPLHSRTNLQENPTTCKESLHNIILECESSVNWNSQLPEGYSCSFWERNVKKRKESIFFLWGGFPVPLKEAARPHPIVGICQLICLSRQMIQASFPDAGVNCDKVIHYFPMAQNTCNWCLFWLGPTLIWGQK
jgi:hypothetical protein